MQGLEQFGQGESLAGFGFQFQVPQAVKSIAREQGFENRSLDEQDNVVNRIIEPEHGNIAAPMTPTRWGQLVEQVR